MTVGRPSQTFYGIVQYAFDPSSGYESNSLRDPQEREHPKAATMHSSQVVRL